MATGTNSKSRLFDIHTWDQLWFDQLFVKEKLFWIYMMSKCDNVGLYTFNQKRVNRELELEVTVEEIEGIFNKEETVIKQIKGNQFLLLDFCRFQHCRKSALLPKSKVFVSYMRDIQRADLVDFFFQYQQDVVSKDTRIFFKAFEDGVLDFKYYSDKSGREVSEYQRVLTLARNHYNEWHKNDIPIPLLSHQGKGMGEGKGKGNEEGWGRGIGHGNGKGSTISSPYQRSKEIAESITSNPNQSLVQNVNAFAKELLRVLPDQDPFTVIQDEVDELRRVADGYEFNLDLIIKQVKNNYYSADV